MDPRMRPVSVEILVVVGVFLLLFQSKLLPIDLTSPVTLLVLLLVVAEFVRILYKLRKLRKAGVDLADESMKSPVWYGVSPKVGNVDYKINKTLQPVYWVIAVAFITAGVVGVIAAVMISISH
jgi:hypothetical protein